MNNNFSTWLESQDIKDIKFAIGGDTSNVSVSKAKTEVVRLHKMAEAGILTTLPKANDYSFEIEKLNKTLN